MVTTSHCASHLRLRYGARIGRWHFFNINVLGLAQPDDLIVDSLEYLGDSLFISCHDQTFRVCISFNTHSL